MLQKWKVMDMDVAINVGIDDVLKMNDHEFVLVPRPEKQTTFNGLFKYKIHQNLWSEFIEYPQDIEGYIHSATFNKSQNKIYLFKSDMIHILNINQMEWNKVDIKMRHFPVITNQNGVHHIIGGWNSSKHMTLSADCKTLENIYDFRQYQGIRCGSLLYVSSKKLLVSIGGLNRFDRIGIWIYSIESNEWQKLNNIAYDFDCVSAVLSSDQSYIVIAGGWNENKNPSNSVHILDVRNDEFKLKKCRICAPYKGPCRLAITGGITDEILVIGWIKKIFRSLEFKTLQLPPIYIMQMIANWYNQEIVHYFHTTPNSKHHTIKMRDILSSAINP